VVGVEGSVHVLSWRAVRTASSDLHLMLMREGGAVRNTSAVAFVDAGRRALVTSSGAYVLHGPPEAEPVTKDMLLANAARIGLADAEDVSEALWSELCSARAVGRSPS
jgi:hypothetical protein